MPNVVFVDSFDHLLTADLLQKYSAAGAAVSINSAAGRNGTSGIRTTASSNSGNLTSVNLGNQSTLYVEVAMKVAALPGSDISTIVLLESAAVQCDVQLTAAGELRVTRAGTSLGITSGAGITAGTFFHIGFMATVHDTAGVYEVRVNGVSKLTGSSADTQATANARADQVRLRGHSALGTDYDDLIISTDGWCGDCRVVAVRPQGPGNYSAWTPSAGLGWQCVDDTTPNGDTDYVSSSTPGQRNSYDFAALGLTGAIKAVQQVTSLRKDDAGTRTVKQFARIGGVDFDGTAVSVGDSYAMTRRVMSTNPAGGDWTVAALDSSEFGVLLET